MASTLAEPLTKSEIRTLQISLIKKDGQTQHRLTIDPLVVAKYSALMKEGVVFPPIRVWWDETHYLLSDGFQRLAAAESAKISEMTCEVCYGSLDDARWDSYAANATHGAPRTARETQRVILMALQHPNAAHLSNVEIARHLHLTESTVRRWRNKLSSSHDEDAIRLVTRGTSSYSLSTTHLGKHGTPRRVKSREKLRSELASMKKDASPNIRRLLVIIEHWAFGQATPADCLEAMKRVLQ
jgi:transposase